MTLKITPATDSQDLVALRLEGRVTASTVEEVRLACADALASGRPIVLQLAGVSFADPPGADALRDLERAGCVLAGCSGFLATLLRGAGAAPSGAADPDEARQLAALRAGDADAFERLVRRQSGRLLAAARRILGSEEDARDAVQEAFVSAYRGFAGFDGESRLSTWLHRIVINAALMKLRSRRRRPEESIDDLLPCFDEDGHWASGLAQPGSAEARIHSQQTRELVQRCIARLPDAYRTVLVLRDIEDRDTAEVAEQLAITPNAVKIRLHRARQALRTSIERERREREAATADPGIAREVGRAGGIDVAMTGGAGARRAQHRVHRLVAALVAVVVASGALRAGAAHAAILGVAPGESIQAAIAAAVDGDEVHVAAGTFVEDLDFLGKAIAVRGSGPASVLVGTGRGPVVTFARGETRASVLDSFTVTGGVAERGGGIYVNGASPTVLRNRIVANRAHRQGSGVYLGVSSGVLRNNLIADSTAVSFFAGDAHGIEIQGGAPLVANNTIVDGDSNGIILRGAAAAVISSNVIAYNGSQTFGEARGRGICDFSGGAATIRHNLFAMNRRGALLTSGGVNYSRITVAQRRIAAARIAGNADGSPRFERRRDGDYRLKPRSRAIDLGDPDPTLADRDGSRNDAGYTGGPLAPEW